MCSSLGEIHTNFYSVCNTPCDVHQNTQIHVRFLAAEFCPVTVFVGDDDVDDDEWWLFDIALVTETGSDAPATREPWRDN